MTAVSETVEGVVPQSRLEQSDGRRSAVEWLRLVAATGIVAFHCRVPGLSVGYAGLSILLMLSVAFSDRSGLAKRFRRLMLPWLFWSCIYAIVVVAKSMATGMTATSAFHPWMLTTGPSIHLWYLPFAFVSCEAAARVGEPYRGTVGPLLLGCAVLPLCARLGTINIEPPLPQWLVGIPAVLIGLSLPRDAGHRTMAYLIVALGASSSFASIALMHGSAAVAETYGIACAAVVVAWNARKMAGGAAKFAGSLTYGIYLLHPLVHSVLRIVPGSRAHATILFLLTLIASAATTYLLKKTPLRSFV